MTHAFILASGSPRRRELLEQLGFEFDVQAANIDETPLARETPAAFAERMALEKARTVQSRNPDRWVLGSDTVVSIDGKIFGKPGSQAEAATMLRALSGHTHSVITGVALCGPSTPDAPATKSICQITQVTLTTLDDHQIATYWRSGEPLGKAGGYAIQGLGASFVEHIDGSYSGVMGLPLFETAAMLAEFGIDVPKLR